MHRLGATGGREAGRRAPYITLLDKGSEGGVQARWNVVGEEPDIVTEAHEGDRGDRALLGYSRGAGILDTGVHVL